MVSQTVFLRLTTSSHPLQLRVSPNQKLSEILPNLDDQDVYYRTRSSIINPSQSISNIIPANASHVDIEVVPRLRGGKGGFGTNLRAAGGRMSLGKNQNNDACRDLSGRRLSTLKEAQRQADLMTSVDDLKAKATAEEKQKLESIERALGLSSSDNAESSSAGSKRLAEIDVGEIARKKHRFEDNKFLEESREIKDNVRSAVSAAMLLKKKKKAKTDTPVGASKPSEPSLKAGQVGAEAVKKAERDKSSMPPPAHLPAAATISA